MQETPYSLSLLIKRAEMADFKQARGHATVAAILANVHRDSKKRPEGFSEMDFMPAYLVPANLRRPGKLQYCELPPEKQRAALASFFGHTVRRGQIVPRKKRSKK